MCLTQEHDNMSLMLTNVCISTDLLLVFLRSAEILLFPGRVLEGYVPFTFCLRPSMCPEVTYASHYRNICNYGYYQFMKESHRSVGAQH